MARSKPQATIDMSVNGHRLTGEQRRGRWAFACETWPDLADRFKGDSTPAGAIDEFMRRVLSTCVRVTSQFVLYEQTGD